MRLLFTMNLPYVPALGGANKSNRYMLESLAGRGHEVRSVVALRGFPWSLSQEQALASVERESAICCRRAEEVEFGLNGVTVHAAYEPGRMQACLRRQIADFGPDWILVSSEDPSQNLLQAALGSTCQVVYLARTTSMLPFGPQAFFPSVHRTGVLAKVTIIIGVSDFIVEYIRQWTGLEASVAPLQFFGKPPFPDLGCFDRGFITMLNPCAVKGISIFAALALRFPQLSFAAVPTWGTNKREREILAQLPNVRLLPASENIDDILSLTKVLLVPSLWGEAKSRAITEAMLRGIPVLASDSGGNRDAKLGTGFLLPVRLIERFGDELDENMLPTALVPEQDLAPWIDALSLLVADRARYERESADSRRAALEYVAKLTVEPLEQALIQNRRAPALKDRLATVPQRAPVRPGERPPPPALSSLQAEQIARMALRGRETRHFH